MTVSLVSNVILSGVAHPQPVISSSVSNFKNTFSPISTVSFAMLKGYFNFKSSGMAVTDLIFI